MIAYTVPDNMFQTIGIHKGDILTLEDTAPQEGDFTLIEYKGQHQLVQIIGKDWMRHYILCVEYRGYPRAVTFPLSNDRVNLVGRLPWNRVSDDSGRDDNG